MNQSKAKPTRPRPVASDLIFMDSVAVQPAPQATEKVFSCPDPWPSISAPKTNTPACQLKPIWPPAMAPLGLPEPGTRVPLNSVAPNPNGVVVPAGNKGGEVACRPVNTIFELYCPQPYPALAPK